MTTKSIRIWREVALGATAVLLCMGLGATRSVPVENEMYDLVIASGRVMDPESGLDAVRNVGIRDGKIRSITAGPLKGKQTIDAKGLVVAPGFIDLHQHGQDAENYAVKAADGAGARSRRGGRRQMVRGARRESAY